MGGEKVTLGGKARGSMPQDGRAYVVVNGKWTVVESDQADGIPADLSSLPDAKKGGRADGSSAAV